MRAIVLLVLGGGLLWLVLHSLGTTRAGGDAGAAAPGVLLTAAESRAEEPAATAAVPVDPPPTRSPTALLSAETARIAAPTPPPASDEVALASELLHRTRDLPRYLQGDGKGIPRGRAALALAFHHALLGSLDEARRLSQEPEAQAAASVAERELLGRMIDPARDRAVLSSITRETPLCRAAAMGWIARSGDEASKAGRNRDAARAFSEILLEEVDAPWPADRASLRVWTDAVARAQAGHQWNRGGDWPAATVTVEKGDSLITVRKRVLEQHRGLLVCTGQIERANELRGGVIHPGQVLRVPTARARMLVDITARWVFYLMDDIVAAAWEVGVGMPGSETRPGAYTVGEKREEPMWFRPGKQPVPYGDPQNPLGTRWIAWMNPDGTSSGLGFHGTKDPGSVGQDLSQGCVRMRQQDVEELFEILPRGASITVQP